ncbi:phospholipase D-like domain-containing protein [Neptuniibacter sp. PT34_22]|uniref:phospholipase D-like domain-containing protein n=1 Tax=Neptuniibacter sp. PT34_22 TaxID=3398205 RepID=UPI0039F640FD
MKFISNTANSNHKLALCELLEWADKCILCTSFLDGKGVKHLSKPLSSGIKNRALEATIYSNGESKYTKSCAIREISKINGLAHITTNGNRRLHSKVYYFEKGNDFTAIIGSANITHNGLVRNIELSTMVSGKTGSYEHQEIYSKLLELEREC